MGSAETMNNDIKQWYYGNPREDMLPFVPRGTRRMLDVGCGWGRFSGLAKERLGIAETWGIELNTEAAALAAERIDHVLNKDVFAALAELPKEHFDCVVFNDVLEHLVDPYKVLAAVQPHLAPRGELVASIPNVRYAGVVFDLAVRGNWTYADYGILDRTHLRFFTRASITAMLEEAGYEVISIEGITPPPSRLGRMVSSLLLPRWRDMRYMQFACRARPRAAAK